MTTDDITKMDQDLATYSSFDALSARVGYWQRRLGKSSNAEALSDAFDEVVGKHSKRVVGLLRIG